VSPAYVYYSVTCLRILYQWLQSFVGSNLLTSLAFCVFLQQLVLGAWKPLPSAYSSFLVAAFLGAPALGAATHAAAAAAVVVELQIALLQNAAPAAAFE